MNLFNDFVCPLGSSLNTRYIVGRKYNKQSPVDTLCSFTVLKAGVCISEKIISRSFGDVGCKIGATYLAADVCGRCYPFKAVSCRC